MIINSSEILFFFGAGASVVSGIPTMKEMAENFSDQIRKIGSQHEQTYYNDIVDTLKQTLEADNIQYIDIETVFSIIDHLKNLDRFTIGDTCMYLSKKYFNDTPLYKKSYDITVLESLENKFQYFIRNCCGLKTSNKVQRNKTFEKFFNEIANSTSNLSSPIPISTSVLNCPSI